MPYTVIDAMQDEVNFLRELMKVEDKEGHTILAAILKQVANSHQRIINRMTNAVDYKLEIVDGSIKSVTKKSDRKTLEEEYPALKKAAEQYNLIKDLVDATPDDEKGSE